MTELTDRITPEMSEEQVLGVILDEIMARAEPDVAEAIRFCAIPHWFNEEIIAWLRGEGLKPSQRSREILAALTELTFVGPYHKRGWAYHENVRDLLLRRWRERDGQEFKELSGRAAGYFEQKLGEGKAALARLLAAVRQVLGKVETLTEDEREEYRREKMYHLLVADEGQGFELFHNMFGKATRFYWLSTCDHLLRLAGERQDYLTKEHQLWWQFGRGKLRRDSGEWKEALEIFEGLWKEDLPSDLGSTLANDLGSLYRAKGEWERAIEYYERSLAIKEKVGDEHGMAPTLNNLGSVYQAKGEWERAIEYYERSLAIKEKVGDEHGMATIFNNLGTVYQAKGEWERAIEYFEKDLAICEKVGDEHGMSTTFNNLGLVYKAKGEWERAVEYFEKDLAICEKVGDEVGAATTMYNIASLYEDMERYDEAVELLERVVEIDERVGHPDLESDRKTLERVKRKAQQ